MYNRRERIASTLRDLIQTCRNAEASFSTAADGVTDSLLRELLRTYAAQRAHFAAEIEAELRQLNGDESAVKIRPGASRHPWIRIRSAVETEDEAALLAECGQGERATLECYRDALTAQLPESLYALVRRQSLEVQHASDWLLAVESHRTACLAPDYRYEEYSGARTSPQASPGEPVNQPLIPRFSLSQRGGGQLLPALGPQQSPRGSPPNLPPPALRLALFLHPGAPPAGNRPGSP